MKSVRLISILALVTLLWPASLVLARTRSVRLSLASGERAIQRVANKVEAKSSTIDLTLTTRCFKATSVIRGAIVCEMAFYDSTDSIVCAHYAAATPTRPVHVRLFGSTKCIDETAWSFDGVEPLPNPRKAGW